MKKEYITIERLLKDGKYYKQIPVYIIFFLTGTLVFLFCILDVRSTAELIRAFIFTGLIALIPFGYILGLRRLCITFKDIKKIKNKQFYIVERTCIEKEVINSKDISQDTQIIFSETDGVWVSHTKSKEFKIGDKCYVFYLEGDKDASAIYSARKFELNPDFLKMICDK